MLIEPYGITLWDSTGAGNLNVNTFDRLSHKKILSVSRLDRFLQRAADIVFPVGADGKRHLKIGMPAKAWEGGKMPARLLPQRVARDICANRAAKHPHQLCGSGACRRQEACGAAGARVHDFGADNATAVEPSNKPTHPLLYQGGTELPGFRDSPAPKRQRKATDESQPSSIKMFSSADLLGILMKGAIDATRTSQYFQRLFEQTAKYQPDEDLQQEQEAAFAVERKAIVRVAQRHGFELKGLDFCHATGLPDAPFVEYWHYPVGLNPKIAELADPDSPVLSVGDPFQSTTMLWHARARNGISNASHLVDMFIYSARNGAGDKLPRAKQATTEDPFLLKAGMPRKCAIEIADKVSIPTFQKKVAKVLAASVKKVRLVTANRAKVKFQVKQALEDIAGDGEHYVLVCETHKVNGKSGGKRKRHTFVVTWVQDVRSKEYVAMVLPLMHVSGLLYGKTTNEGAGRLADMVLALGADLDRIQIGHEAIPSDSHPLAERDTVESDGIDANGYVLPLTQRSKHVAMVPTPADSLLAPFLASLTAGNIFAARASKNPAEQEHDNEGCVRLYHEMSMNLHKRKFQTGPHAGKSIFAFDRAKAMHEEKFDSGPNKGKSIVAYNMGKVLHEDKYEEGPHEGKSKHAVLIGTLSHAERFADSPSEGKSISAVEKGRLSMAEKIKTSADTGKARHAVDMATAAHAKRDNANRSLLGKANGQRSMQPRLRPVKTQESLLTPLPWPQKG